MLLRGGSDAQGSPGAVTPVDGKMQDHVPAFCALCDFLLIGMQLKLECPSDASACRSSSWTQGSLEVSSSIEG